MFNLQVKSCWQQQTPAHLWFSVKVLEVSAQGAASPQEWEEKDLVSCLHGLWGKEYQMSGWPPRSQIEGAFIASPKFHFSFLLFAPLSSSLFFPLQHYCLFLFILWSTPGRNTFLVFPTTSSIPAPFLIIAHLFTCSFTCSHVLTYLLAHSST